MTNIYIEINDTSPEAESGDKLTLYSEKEKLSKWFHNLFLEELKNKVLNPIALEQMKLKGIEPKKQPRDIILIIVVPSDKRVHIGISIPDIEEYNNFNLKEFIKNALKPINSYNVYYDDSHNINNENKMGFCFGLAKFLFCKVCNNSVSGSLSCKARKLGVFGELTFTTK